MSKDEELRAKMEFLFRTRPWGGVISKEEALAYALAYRDSLDTQEREVYDEQILMERHPSKAQELIEVMRERGYFATKELATTVAGS